MDQFKKYLRDHESLMEPETPDEEGIWQRITLSEIKKTKRTALLLLFIRYAAAACILVAIGLGVMRFNKTDRQPAPSIAAKTNVPYSRDTPANAGKQVAEVPVGRREQKTAGKSEPVKEVSNVEESYTQLVNYQLRKLRSTPVYAESPEYFVDFKLHLQQMDLDETTLRNDMEEYGFNEQLFEGLINIYQQKLNLLKSLQREINKMNNKVRHRQPAGQSNAYYLDI